MEFFFRKKNCLIYHQLPSWLLWNIFLWTSFFITMYSYSPCWNSLLTDNCTWFFVSNTFFILKLSLVFPVFPEHYDFLMFSGHRPEIWTSDKLYRLFLLFISHRKNVFANKTQIQALKNLGKISNVFIASFPWQNIEMYFMA